MFIRFDMIHEREKIAVFHVPQPTCLFPLETPLRLSRNMLHGWKDNSMLVKALAACTYLSVTFGRLAVSDFELGVDVIVLLIYCVVRFCILVHFRCVVSRNVGEHWSYVL